MTEEGKSHRFQMRIGGVARTFMIPFGVTKRQAYAQVRDGVVHVRFGPMFDERVRVDNIESAEVSRWPRWAGVGLRTNLRGSIGLIGGYGETVKITLKEPQPVHLYLVPARMRCLHLALEDAEGFLEMLGKPAPKRSRAKAA
jgi:hypothetical protein